MNPRRCKDVLIFDSPGSSEPGEFLFSFFRHFSQKTADRNLALANTVCAYTSFYTELQLKSLKKILIGVQYDV